MRRIVPRHPAPGNHALDPHEPCRTVPAHAPTEKDLFELKKVGEEIYAAAAATSYKVNSHAAVIPTNDGVVKCHQLFEGPWHAAPRCGPRQDDRPRRPTQPVGTRRQNQFSRLEFLGELRQALPFAIRRIQADHGTEFSLMFALAVQGLGHSPPLHQAALSRGERKVERSHRVDNEEFWGRRTFATFDEAAEALHGWEDIHDRIRFSIALKGRTPAVKLAAVLAAAQKR